VKQMGQIRKRIKEGKGNGFLFLKKTTNQMNSNSNLNSNTQK
jgi:hypothetical protein